ncbi:class I SAM-dependent methyltransferase [Aureimonas sp. D3]|uniref:class I SAM-dependent methyltransferase n=1 Tax=Aureimonas sp. D3 TaxID=1638164 RepID=UPI000AED014C|nr:phospholipid methyltransferase [Aureimonas sp. D3]
MSRAGSHAPTRVLPDRFEGDPRLSTTPLRKPPLAEASFLREWLRQPLKVGAVSPSSKALAERMASYVPLPGEDGVILELGPGTGVVTRALLKRGVEADRLLCLEYAPEFCALLRSLFPAVHILRGDAYRPGADLDAWLDGRPLAAVVSSLPLMARPEDERSAALGAYLDRLPVGAPFVQFTYSPALPVRPERVEAKVEVSPWVKLNIPPARVLVYRRGCPKLAGTIG